MEPELLSPRMVGGRNDGGPVERACLLLAGLDCYGPTRTNDDEPLPKWRRGAKRPSCLDLVTLLRQQIAEKPPKFPTAQARPTYQTLVTAAAA